MRRLIAPALALAIAGCSSPTTRSTQDDRMQAISEAARERSEQRQREYLDSLLRDNYPDRGVWKTTCRADQVTNLRVCTSEANARRINQEGAPYGDSRINVRVTYYNGRGPEIAIGGYNVPGTVPMLRVDENEPVRLAGASAQRDLVRQMITGRVLRGQYDAWPEGATRFYLDLQTAGPGLAGLASIAQ